MHPRILRRLNALMLRGLIYTIIKLKGNTRKVSQITVVEKLLNFISGGLERNFLSYKVIKCLCTASVSINAGYMWLLTSSVICMFSIPD